MAKHPAPRRAPSAIALRAAVALLCLSPGSGVGCAAESPVDAPEQTTASLVDDEALTDQMPGEVGALSSTSAPVRRASTASAAHASRAPRGAQADSAAGRDGPTVSEGAGPRSLRDALRGVDVIAHVVVREAKGEEGKWGAAQQPILFTRYRLDVLAAARGAHAGETLELRLPGGHVGDKGFSMSGVPTLLPDDELVVVLDHERPGHPLVGGEAGLLRVLRDGVFAQGRAVTAIDDKGLHLSPPRSRVPAPAPVGDSAPVAVKQPERGLTVAEALLALASLEVTP